MAQTNKLNWLLILQGWSMLLVVVGHSGLNGLDMTTEPTFSRVIREIIYSFHMPLFMIIAGYLYFMTKVKKDTEYFTLIKDKLYRLGIPFLFFTLATMSVKPLFNSLMNRPAEFSFNELINAFLYPQNNPLGEMWFIGTLFMLFIYSPIFKYCLKYIYSEIILLIVVLGLYFTPHAFGGELLCSRIVFKYAIWFYIGILFCKYNISSILKRFIYLPILIILFIALYYLRTVIGLPIFVFSTTLVGCVASLALALNIDKVLPNCFSSFRDYTYQIYLMAIFFQWLFRVQYEHYLFPNYYEICYVLNIFIGLYIPVIISKCILRINFKYINPLFGLK